MTSSPLPSMPRVPFDGWRIDDRLVHPSGSGLGTVLEVWRKDNAILALAIRWDEGGTSRYPPDSFRCCRPVDPKQLAVWLTLEPLGPGQGT